MATFILDKYTYQIKFQWCQFSHEHTKKPNNICYENVYIKSSKSDVKFYHTITIFTIKETESDTFTLDMHMSQNSVDYDSIHMW